MASPATCLKGLKPKHYILAVLLATLAAAVVVTVFFVVLSPARIDFSIINPTSVVWEEDRGVDLNFTLAANNTSQRADVWYHTILVDLTNNTDTGPSSEEDNDSWVWTSAVITNTSAITSWQPHGRVFTVNATVSAPGDPWTSSFINGTDVRSSSSSSAFTVKVTAVARFKVGFARTRLYDINLVCSPVRFSLQNRHRQNRWQNGRGRAAAPAVHAHVLPPVECVPS